MFVFTLHELNRYSLQYKKYTHLPSPYVNIMSNEQALFSQKNFTVKTLENCW